MHIEGDCLDGNGDCEYDTLLVDCIKNVQNKPEEGWTTFFDYYGTKICNEIDPPTTIIAEGDPHVKTWGGKWFDVSLIWWSFCL